jgi:hypothetical protein
MNYSKSGKKESKAELLSPKYSVDWPSGQGSHGIDDVAKPVSEVVPKGHS